MYRKKEKIMQKKQEIIYYIKDKIAKKEWLKETKILSENQFCDYFKVSRGTVRTALAILEKENIIYSVKNRGYYVKNTETVTNKDCILLLTKDRTFVGENNIDTKKLLLDYIKDYAEKIGYKFIIYVNNKTVSPNEALTPIIDRIAGIISFHPFSKDEKYFENMNIPLVRTYTWEIGEYPTVIFNGEYIIDFFEKYIEKYKLNDILVFSFDFMKIYRITDIRHISVKFFDQYNLHLFDLFSKKNYIYKKIKKILSETETVPDAVIFLDNNIFDIAKDLFEEYDRIFGHTKIISHMIDNTEYTGPYNVVKIQYNIEDVAKKTVLLLDKLIKKEFIKKYNIISDPKITDEYSE